MKALSTSIQGQHTKSVLRFTTGLSVTETTQVLLYPDLCKHFPGILKGNVSIMKGWDGSRDYTPMVTDIHKGQHFIHQPLYTPAHQPGGPFLYRSIHQTPNTTSSLLCSLSAVMVMVAQIKTKMCIITTFSSNICWHEFPMFVSFH